MARQDIGKSRFAKLGHRVWSIIGGVALMVGLAVDIPDFMRNLGIWFSVPELPPSDIPEMVTCLVWKYFLGVYVLACVTACFYRRYTVSCNYHKGPDLFNTQLINRSHVQTTNAQYNLFNLSIIAGFVSLLHCVKIALAVAKIIVLNFPEPSFFAWFLLVLLLLLLVTIFLVLLGSVFFTMVIWASKAPSN